MWSNGNRRGTEGEGQITRVQVASKSSRGGEHLLKTGLTSIVFSDDGVYIFADCAWGCAYDVEIRECRARGQRLREGARASSRDLIKNKSAGNRISDS